MARLILLASLLLPGCGIYHARVVWDDTLQTQTAYVRQYEFMRSGCSSAGPAGVEVDSRTMSPNLTLFGINLADAFRVLLAPLAAIPGVDFGDELESPAGCEKAGAQSP